MTTAIEKAKTAGVAKPARIAPNTERISTARGTKDFKSSLATVSIEMSSTFGLGASFGLMVARVTT